MMKIYKVEMPGNGDFQFTIGETHREHGEVMDIKEMTEEDSYDRDSYPDHYHCVIKIIFKHHEIVIPANNPLVVIYRYETGENSKK